MVKIPKTWVNKKSPTNPERKEQHQERKTKKALMHEIEDRDWEEQLKEYTKNAD